MQRPQNREIWKKIADASEALKQGRFQVGVSRHLISDLAELQVSEKDLPRLLAELLKEIENAKPHECYKGRRPPLRSIEPAIQNEELWEYAWNSQRFNKRMYIKFVVKKQWYLHVRCHEDRPPDTLL
jgi:hypothetical protein